MKKTISFLMILVFSFANAYSQMKNWPYVDYSYAKAYLYNLKGTPDDNTLIKNGEINTSITKNEVKLSEYLSKKIIDLSNGNVTELTNASESFFIPNHAVVFFDAKNQPVASVEISVNGNSIKLFPKKKTFGRTRYIGNPTSKNRKRIIEKYIEIVKATGLPVFDNKEAYKNYAENKPVGQLKLVSNHPIKQLVDKSDKRFDLSGIVMYKDSVYIVADKEWNNHIYKVETTDLHFSITSKRSLCPSIKRIDYEGIDVCKDKFYILEEYKNNVYEVDMTSCKLKILPIPWENYKIDRTKWGNAGLEGLAYDCENEILYLAKEREPQRIFKVDLKQQTISEPFKDLVNVEHDGHDISDIKYENGALYLLKRGNGLIVKINLKTLTKYSLSFHHLVFKNQKRLYKNNNPQYGMAEALLLTKDEIWLGFDNNGDMVSDYGKSLGLKGNKPIIMIFERPEGF